MNWSQLKKQIRALMCDELRHRVDFHKAVYRNSPEPHPERVWITLDGEQVFEFRHEPWSHASSAAESVAAEPSAEAVVGNAGVEPTALLGESLHRYLELPIAAALESANPIIRAFAMLDRRTGKRSLARVSMTPADPVLVRTFHALRTGCAQRDPSTSRVGESGP